MQVITRLLKIFTEIKSSFSISRVRDWESRTEVSDTLWSNLGHDKWLQNEIRQRIWTECT
jgi:hypothetical protein